MCVDAWTRGGRVACISSRRSVSRRRRSLRLGGRSIAPPCASWEEWRREDIGVGDAGYWEGVGACNWTDIASVGLQRVGEHRGRPMPRALYGFLGVDGLGVLGVLGLLDGRLRLLSAGTMSDWVCLCRVGVQGGEGRTGERTNDTDVSTANKGDG